jgi:aminopeptidase YwaD
MVKRFSVLIFSILFFLCTQTSAQDSLYARHIVKTLTADKFHGRGYVKSGDNKAATYLASEFKKLGLKTVSGTYYQDFSLPVNAFPGKIRLKIGNKQLIPGKDFIVSPACPSTRGTFNILRLEQPCNSVYSKDVSKDFVMIDKSRADSTGKLQLDSIMRNPPKSAGLLIAEPTKLTWSVARKVNAFASARVLIDSFPGDANELEIHVENRFIKEYKTKNVIAVIPGTTNPDSFIVFTAHYDHIGRMGKRTIFPGANDNASGVSMVLNLAKHYSDSANQTGKTLAFILFAGEEAGLVGSEYFVNHPMIPLEKIRFLINMDMMGTGEEGVMVVNGELHETEYNLLKSINDSNRLLKEVGKRGTAKNSDHYHFSEKGVPAFFFYTTGGPKAYHDIYDKADNLTFAGYKGVFQMITGFVSVIGR